MNKTLTVLLIEDSPDFAALVQQHLNLVYATAWRQVGDRGMAEEI